MNLDKKSVIDIAKKQLAIDLGCEVEAFDRSTNTVLNYRELDGRRRFGDENSFIRLVSFGNGALISCDKKINVWCNKFFQNKRGTNCFEHHIMTTIDREIGKYNKRLNLVQEFYLPNINYKTKVSTDLRIKFFEKDDIKYLYKDKRFRNALVYDEKSIRPDILALVAYNQSDEIVAIAGAGEDCKSLWQVGVDVLPNYRNKGVGKYLVYTLSKEIIKRNIIPYYGTWASNIASRNIALECGYFPAWVEVYSIDR